MYAFIKTYYILGSIYAGYIAWQHKWFKKEKPKIMAIEMQVLNDKK